MNECTNEWMISGKFFLYMECFFYYLRTGFLAVTDQTKTECVSGPMSPGRRNPVSG